MHVLFTKAHPIVYAQRVMFVTLRQNVGAVTTTAGVVELAQVPILLISKIPCVVDVVVVFVVELVVVEKIH